MDCGGCSRPPGADGARDSSQQLTRVPARYRYSASAGAPGTQGGLGPWQFPIQPWQGLGCSRPKEGLPLHAHLVPASGLWVPPRKGVFGGNQGAVSLARWSFGASTRSYGRLSLDFGRRLYLEGEQTLLLRF